MKRLLSLVFILISVAILVSCVPEVIIDDNFSEDRVVTTSYINMSNEYNVEDSTIELYYLKESIVAYVDIKDYLRMLDGVYISNEFEIINGDKKDLLNINYSITYDTEVYDYEMSLDANLDLINVASLAFFDNYMQTTETDYSDGLIDVDSIIVDGSGTLFDLGKYGFDMIAKDDKFLMPLTIASSIFNQGNYFDTYFNGEIIYGIDTSDLESDEIKTILTSKYNKSDMPEEMKLYNYNYYRFIIDYFYGLKSDRNIVDGETFINKEAFLAGDVNRNIFDISNKLDDLHTSHITRGFYNNEKMLQSYQPKAFGPNVSAFMDGEDAVWDQAQTHFGVKGIYIDIKDFEFIDNNKTLIIYIYEFTVDTPTHIEALIKTAKPETENIVLDLSLNTGGNLGSVLRMFTLTTNEEVWYHFLNPLNGQKLSYSVKGEKPAYSQYKYFVKTSSITYSAANLSASIAKELNIKVIGQKSSGGAAALSFFVFPDGAIIHMSSNTVLTNSTYNSIEKGIIPDVVLQNLYDANEISRSLK